MPHDLLWVLVVRLLGGDEGGAEQVVQAWLSLRLVCKHLWTGIADVPLDLRFTAPLTDTQVGSAASSLQEASWPFDSFRQALLWCRTFQGLPNSNCDCVCPGDIPCGSGSFTRRPLPEVVVWPLSETAMEQGRTDSMATKNESLNTYAYGIQ